MSIAGIDWDLADKIYAQEEDRIREETQRRQQEMAKDYRERGMYSSGPRVSAMHRIHMETLSALAGASIYADCDVVTGSGYNMSEPVITNIIKRLDRRLTKYISMFMHSAKQSLAREPAGRSMLPSLQRKSNTTKAKLLGQARRELEIREGRLTMEETKKRRFQFLHKLYEMVDGDESRMVLRSDIAKELGIDDSLARRIAIYLAGEHLIQTMTFEGITKITHFGVTEVERALSEPDKPTEYFPPVSVIYVGRDMISSQIQQASPGATQRVTISADKHQELKDLIQLLKTSVDKLNLNGQQETDLQAEIQTIEAQASSSEPKRIIIKESLNTIKSILQGAAGSLLASEVLTKVVAFLSAL